MDPKLLEMLVCPVTKGPLVYDRDRQELVSKSARLAYPIRDGIPVMLEEEARRLGPDELQWEQEAQVRMVQAPRPLAVPPPAAPALQPVHSFTVSFTILIPARFASTRLPGKPLADRGVAHGRARRGARARPSGAARVGSRPTTSAIATGGRGVRRRGRA